MNKLLNIIDLILLFVMMFCGCCLDGDGTFCLLAIVVACFGLLTLDYTVRWRKYEEKQQ